MRPLLCLLPILISLLASPAAATVLDDLEAGNLRRATRTAVAEGEGAPRAWVLATGRAAAYSSDWLFDQPAGTLVRVDEAVPHGSPATVLLVLADDGDAADGHLATLLDAAPSLQRAVEAGTTVVRRGVVAPDSVQVLWLDPRPTPAVAVVPETRQAVAQLRVTPPAASSSSLMPTLLSIFVFLTLGSVGGFAFLRHRRVTEAMPVPSDAELLLDLSQNLRDAIAAVQLRRRA